MKKGLVLFCEISNNTQRGIFIAMTAKTKESLSQKKTLKKNKALLTLMIFSTSICLISLWIMLKNGSFRQISIRERVCQIIPTGNSSLTIEDFLHLPDEKNLLILRSDRLAISQQKNPAPSRLELLNLESKALDVLRINGDYGQFRPSSMSLYKENGQTYIFIVNYRSERSSIDRFLLNEAEKTLTFEASYTDPFIQYPRSVIGLAKDRFFVLNEFGLYTAFGHMIEDTFGLRQSYGAYFDGEKAYKVIEGLKHGASAAWDESKSLIYIVEQGDKKIRAFQGPKGLWKAEKEFESFKNFDAILDQIKIDTKGQIWISAHQDGIALKSYFLKPLEAKAPSSIYLFDPKTDHLENIWTSTDGPISGATHGVAIDTALISSSIFSQNLVSCAFDPSS